MPSPQISLLQCRGSHSASLASDIPWRPPPAECVGIIRAFTHLCARWMTRACLALRVDRRSCGCRDRWVFSSPLLLRPRAPPPFLVPSPLTPFPSCSGFMSIVLTFCSGQRFLRKPGRIPGCVSFTFPLLLLWAGFSVPSCLSGFSLLPNLLGKRIQTCWGCACHDARELYPHRGCTMVHRRRWMDRCPLSISAGPESRPCR
jgi:hypothetical protein